MNNDNTVKNTPKRSTSSVPFRILKYVLAAVLLAVLVYFGFTCEVREGNCAVILRFGAVRREVDDAGLYFKLPWPFETVVSYDNRLQYLESDYLETTTKDKRNVIIQSYAVWSINDTVRYHNSVGAQGNTESFIKNQIFSAINSVMGAYDLSSLVSLDAESIKTDEIQSEIYERVRNTCLTDYGVDIHEVSILRISLPDTNLQSVFEQMRADRQKDIDTILANAERDANKITADADAEAAEIIAGGVLQASEIKAQTEKEVAQIYAEAQAANLDLYKFLKNLDTLTASVNGDSILLVKMDQYPFSVLAAYGDYLTDEGDETVIKDLGYILTQLPEADRKALIDAIYALMESAQKSGEAVS